MLILHRPSPLSPQSGSEPALLGSSGCGSVTSSAVRLAVPVRWDEAGDNVSHASPSLLFPSTSSARRAVGARGAAQVCRARLCHVPLPPPAPAEAPAAAGRDSEELLPPAPTHSQSTKRFLVKEVLKFGAWSCSPGPGGTRAAGTAPISARETEGPRSVLALEW